MRKEWVSTGSHLGARLQGRCPARLEILEEAKCLPGPLPNPVWSQGWYWGQDLSAFLPISKVPPPVPEEADGGGRRLAMELGGTPCHPSQSDIYRHSWR